MTRFEQLKQIQDVHQLIAFLDKWGSVCRIKANKENIKTWCKQYPLGEYGCKQCQVDYWNEVIKDD